MEMVIYLSVIAVVGFVQNMAFTFSSRSRNSGDWRYHRKAAILSNGVWFLCQMFVWKQVMPIIMNPEWTLNGTIKLVITAAVYILATTEGSVLQMRRMIKSETGKRKVGA